MATQGNTSNVNISLPAPELANPLSSNPEMEKESPSTEMETFEVELVKDQQGLGITIAGYVCEKGS